MSDQAKKRKPKVTVKNPRYAGATPERVVKALRRPIKKRDAST